MGGCGVSPYSSVVSKPYVSERISQPGGASALPPAPHAQKSTCIHIPGNIFFFILFISKVFVITYLQQSRRHPEFDILPDVQKSYSVMYYSIKNTQECSPNTISGFFHGLPAIRILCQDLRAALQRSCASAGSASWVYNRASVNEGVPSPKYHFCLQTVYNIPVEMWSVFNWLCIWLLVLFIQRPCSGKILSWHQKWDQFIKSTHNHGMWWRQSSCQATITAFEKMPPL